MKNIKLLVFILLIALSWCASGQPIGMTFQEAGQAHVSISSLDSLYKSAVHSDPSKAVFTTEEAQQKLQQAYNQLLQDFGKFLASKNFKWEKKTKCFNRIYFSKEGTIDYFLYNFLGQPAEKPSDSQQETFSQLLRLFIKEYQFALTAQVKFAQCSPVTYYP